VENTFEFLRGTACFKNLSDEEIRHVIEYSREREFNTGEVVFYEGDPADRFYIIADGSVEVWTEYGGDQAEKIADRDRGQIFGEMALIDDLPRSATVVAGRPTSTLYVQYDDFQRLLKDSPAVAFSLVRSLSAMVRQSNETFIEDLREKNERLEAALADLEQAQEELLRTERLSNLGKFSSMILHDIRNPLSVVRGYAEMMSVGSELPEKPKQYIENILFEIQRLNQLANELLDYSRGEIRLNIVPVGLQGFLERVHEYVIKRFASRNITISVHSDYADPVLFDSERIFRVLVNLAENARKAMSSEGTFTITAHAENGLLVFEVTDDGEGMSQEVLEHIFEPFYSRSKSGGTGLGMVIVKNVVEAHDGALRIESEPGRGTTIYVKLPLRG
jgi:signal transduction histidine kinase